MIVWVCRLEWALRPYYRRESYDRLGILSRVGFTPILLEG
jgi:hypothetical protein